MNELAIANPVSLPELKVVYPERKTPEAREYPRAQNSFMRWQVRESVRRSEVNPIWEGDVVVGYCNGDAKVTVQKLLGFGETKSAAERMARRSK